MLARVDAEQIGSMKNRLRLLSDDRKSINMSAWENVTGLRRTETSRALGVSRTATYRSKAIPVKKETLDKVVRLAFAADLAFEILGENVEETRKWIMSPNQHFFGDSPFEVCMRGDGQDVIRWLLIKLGRADGAPF